MERFKSTEDKAAYVHGVFTQIAPHYDILNSIISFNQDKYWRREAVRALDLNAGSAILDVACGTCQITCEVFNQVSTATVEALDINEDMLETGRERVAKLHKENHVHFCVGDAMALPYADNTFDGAISAFALRNVPHIETVLAEMKRVVKPGGKVVILELGKPEQRGFKELHRLYVEKIMPKLGTIIGRDSSYYWLSESWKHFMTQEELRRTMERAGLEEVRYKNLTGGVVAVHSGTA